MARNPPTRHRTPPKKPLAGLLLTVGEKKPSFAPEIQREASFSNFSIHFLCLESFGTSLWSLCYLAVLVGFSAYGIHRWCIIYLFLKNRRRVPQPVSHFVELPVVTVQLPIFNERYVAERLLRAVNALDYPREKLEVQVLDDSTDDTRQVIEQEVARLRATGLDIVLLHRTDRTGFKAGALENGMHQAKGDYIFILDADFLPDAGHPPQDDPFLHRPGRRHDPDALGPSQPRLFAADPRAGDVPRRPPAAGADRPLALGPVLQLQRHRRPLAEIVHRAKAAAGSTTR